MNSLRLLVKSISRRKLRFAKPIGQNDDLADRLYFMLRERPDTPDEKIMNRLFSGNHKRTYFRRVKRSSEIES